MGETSSPKLKTYLVMKPVCETNKIKSNHQERFPKLAESGLKIYERDNYIPYFTENFGCLEEWGGKFIPYRNLKYLVQSITFRLADSLPQKILKIVEYEIQNLSGDKKDTTRYHLYQSWLDKGLGSCALENRIMAQTVMQALYHHDGKKYDLLVWSIMPNHVHTLIWVKYNLSSILQSWKSYTGKWGLNHNKELNLGIDIDAKSFWMNDYWDRFIRNEEHFNNTVRYILKNPAHARLPAGHIAYEFTGSNLR